MSRGRYARKSKARVPILLIVAIIVMVLTVVLGFVTMLWYMNQQKNHVGDSQITNHDMPDQTYTIALDAETEEAQETQTISETEEMENSEPDKKEEQEIVTQPSVVIIQRADAEYEKWLAATLIVCVSMEYPDFELEGVYAASATGLEDKLNSDGSYIVFRSGGERLAIHAKALAGERTKSGTKDISTEVIGFASFDRVDAASIDFSSMEQLVLDDLSELISQSLLVSIYTH